MERATKWLIVGILSSIFNPVPTGLVLGYVLFTEPDLKNVGKITIVMSFLIMMIWLLFLIPLSLISVAYTTNTNVQAGSKVLSTSRP